MDPEKRMVLEATMIEVDLKMDDVDQALQHLNFVEGFLKCEAALTDLHTIKRLERIVRIVCRLAHSRNMKFGIALKRFLGHWLGFFASLSIREFCQMMQRLGMKREDNGCLLLFVSNAFDRMDKTDAQQMAVLCADLVEYCPVDYIRDSKDEMWIVMREILPPPEIERVLVELEDHRVVKKATIMCQKNSAVFVPKLFSRVSLEYIGLFLSDFPLQFEFDLFDLTARVVEGIHSEDVEDNEQALTVLPLLIGRLALSKNEDELQSLKPVWKGVIRRISEASESVQYILIHSLLMAQKEKLVDVDEVLPFLVFSDEQPLLVQQGLLMVIFDGLSRTRVREEMFQFMKNIATVRDRELFLFLISLVTEHYRELCEINAGETASLVERMFVPESNDRDIRNSLFILQVECDLFEGESRERICEDLMRRGPSSRVVDIIVERKMTVSIENLDWFDESVAHHNFRVVGEYIDPYFVIEVLNSCGVIPEYIEAPLECLAGSRDVLGPVIFTSVFGTLSRAVGCLGFQSMKVGQDVSRIVDTSAHWVTEREMKRLLKYSVGLFEKSAFGKFVDALLKFLVVFKVGVTFQACVLDAVIMFCCILAPLLPERTLGVITAFYPDIENAKPPIPKKVTGRISDHLKASFLHDFPLSSGKAVCLCAAKVLGVSEAFSIMDSAIMRLIEDQIEVAEVFADVLPKTLPVMRTFTVFENVPERAEWVARCRAEIPEDAWIVKIEHQPVQASDEEDRPEAEEERTYAHSEVSVVPGMKLHSAEEATLANTISFLWHSRLDLPESVAFKDLEQYVLTNCENRRLVAGFLAYSRLKGYPVDVDAFLGSLTVDRRDTLSLYANAVLFSFVKGPFDSLTDPTLAAIRKTLTEVGCHTLDVRSVRKALAASKRFVYVVIESIANIDVDYFGYYNKGNVDKWALKQINGRTTAEDYSRVIAALSDTIFAMDKSTKSMYCLPTNDDFVHPRLLSFTRLQDPMRMPDVSNNFAAHLVEQLDCELVVSKDMVNCIASLPATRATRRKFYAELYGQLPNCQDFPGYLLRKAEGLAALYAKDMFTRSVPPSFVRGVVRHVIPYNDSHRSVFRTAVYLSSRDFPRNVHGALRYYGCNGLLGDNSVDVCDRLDAGARDLQTVMTAHTELLTGSPRQALIVDAFMNMKDNEIEALHAWKTPSEARDEFFRLLIDCVCRSDTPCYSAKDAMGTITRWSGMEEYILTPSFVDQPNALNVCIAIKGLRTDEAVTASRDRFFADNALSCAPEVRAIVSGTKDESLIWNLLHAI